MTPILKLRICGAGLAVWSLVTLAVCVADWRSPPSHWGYHDAFIINALALILAAGLFTLYRFKPSILFGIHTMVSLLLGFGIYLMAMTGITSFLEHDPTRWHQRHAIATGILVALGCIDVWYRIACRRRQQVD